MDSMTSIVILSYNTYRYTRDCIESIRRFTEPGTYEIIVVDNGSKDITPIWLKGQHDVRCIFNKENAGFPKGCNQGMAISKGTEILLLNSDTQVTPRWLTQLRIALYSRDDIGAVSCMTNCSANFQRVVIDTAHWNGLLPFAEQFNHSDSSKWYRRLVITGFCLLFKRDVYEQIGELDERFSPGNYEDDDYCLRIWQAGYQCLLCGDTFIWHWGSSSFVQRKLSPIEQENKVKNFQELLSRNFKLFKSKWSVDTDYEKKISYTLLDLVKNRLKKGMKVLEVDCHCGMNLCFIENQFPWIQLEGVTKNKNEAQIAEMIFPVRYCKCLEKDLADLLGQKKYNYILLNDCLDRIRDKDQFIQQLGKNLYDGGAIIYILEGGICSYPSI